MHYRLLFREYSFLSRLASGFLGSMDFSVHFFGTVRHCSFFLKNNLKLIVGWFKAGASAEKERGKKLYKHLHALGSRWEIIIHLPKFAVLVLRLLYEEKFLSKNPLGYN